MRKGEAGRSKSEGEEEEEEDQRPQAEAQRERGLQSQRFNKPLQRIERMHAHFHSSL